MATSLAASLFSLLFLFMWLFVLQISSHSAQVEPHLVLACHLYLKVWPKQNIILFVYGRLFAEVIFSVFEIQGTRMYRVC